ncbi:hypothetical protein [Acetobacter tropicalis]|nr:hypothetical protein [Acetobacter tropicalis]
METLLLRRIFGTKGEAALSLFQGRFDPNIRLVRGLLLYRMTARLKG